MEHDRARRKDCGCEEVTEEMIAAAYWTIRPYLREDGDAEEILTRAYHQMRACTRGTSGSCEVETD